MAHGGSGIADAPDGRVVFVHGAIPGDRVEATLTKVKPRWARADAVRILEPSSIRVEPACEAAAAGAGCCDFSHVSESAQLELKRAVLLGQLRALAGRSGVMGSSFAPERDVETVALDPHTGWRTRVRLGVDAQGRAGFRKFRSNDLVTAAPCSQPVPGLLDGIVGPAARVFTPGSELVVVVDADGERHVVETVSAQRGRRVERMTNVVEGSGEVTERIGESEFRFPATAFWQAHVHAPRTYSDVISRWAGGTYVRRIGWDLYGGVGSFVPAISAALGGGRVVSVDYSTSATSRRQPALEGLEVDVVRSKVEDGIDQLPAPGLVVLDPPRAGAGAGVITAIAQAGPERIIHVGCDPATFSRDIATFGAGGYQVTRMVLVDAFPSTHHFEVLACLEPATAAGGGGGQTV